MNVLYEIKHSLLPVVYYGITNDTSRRFSEHKNSTSNKLLKYYFELYGSNKFIFKILVEDTIRSNIEELEELLIAEAKSLDRLIVCNVLIGSVCTGDSNQVGENHWNASLTEKDILDIRTIYSEGGITQKEIGEVYGVSNKVISKITSGIRWSKVTGNITLNSSSNKVANRRKLTDKQVLEVRESTKQEYLLNNKISVPTIAYQYGINRGVMRGLLKGDYYKQLSGPLLGVDYFLNYGRKNE